MRRMLLVAGLVLGLGLLTLLMTMEQPVRANGSCDRYVLGIDAGDQGDCSDEGDPCRTVQYAISQADPGDRICVAKHSLAGPLVYTGTVVITKSITLDGAWDGMCVDPNNLNCSFQSIPCDPANVTLNAEGAGRVISMTGNVAPTIHCFTITGGNATGLGGDPETPLEYDAGGGIYSRDAAPIITRNVITGNYGCDCSATPGRGGGIYLLNAPATTVISGNVIAGNVGAGTTEGGGGGLVLRDSYAQILNNVIQENRAGSTGQGGGLMILDGSPTVADNVMQQNQAATGTQGRGGGIFVQSSMPVVIERNVLQFNRALEGAGDPALYNLGGGIYFEGPFAMLRDNELYGNVATLLDSRGRGGGMYLRDLSETALVQGNVIANDNRASYAGDGAGGAIYLETCYATVAENQIFSNLAASASPGYGGGIYVSGGGGLIQSNVVTGNRAVLGATGGTGWGGGMALYDSEVLVQDNRVMGNTADSAPGATGLGGGIYVRLGAPQIVRNEILSNTTSAGAGSGGGLLLLESRAWVDGNIILYNQNIGALVNNGGGIGVDSCPAFTLTNNIVAQNAADDAGSGVAIALSDGRVDNNTIADNAAGDGVGIHVDKNSEVDAHNNIVISQTVGIAVADPGNSAVVADHMLFEANGTDYGLGVASLNEVSGPANLLADYHLDAGSGAIDHAQPLIWVAHDVDGDMRPYRGAPDVGADEVSCLAHVVGGGGVYFTIQEAVGVATSGETVRVAEGTCYENVAITETLTLEGGWDQAFVTRASDPASVTTIDGMGRGRAISITEASGSIAPVIDGFTLTGGDATGLGGSGIIYGYDVGGGLYSGGADTTVSHCIVRDNVASTSGIGWGGGLGFYWGNATVRDCLIEDNVASTTSSGYGGGVYFRYDAPTLCDNIIQDNVASMTDQGYGGGVASHSSALTMERNNVRRNVANKVNTNPSWKAYGGGIFLYGTTDPLLRNNVVADNRLVGSGDGSGLYLAYTDLRLLHVTLARNTGGNGQGVYAVNGATVGMTNTIVVSHAVGVEASGAGTVIDLAATLWGTGAWANGDDVLTTCGGVVNTTAPELWEMPGFVDAEDRDYHINAGSAAVDAGIAAGVLHDIDGDRRPMGTAPDLGADEFGLMLFLPLILRG